MSPIVVRVCVRIRVPVSILFIPSGCLATSNGQLFTHTIPSGCLVADGTQVGGDADVSAPERDQDNRTAVHLCIWAKSISEVAHRRGQ